jgi:hypothetical protein
MNHSRILDSLAGLLVGSLTGLCGCAGVAASGLEGSFRHAALRDLAGESRTGGGEHRASLDFSLPRPSRVLATRCELGFRHPVLNRCETLEQPASPRRGLGCAEPAACRAALAVQASRLVGRSHYLVAGKNFPKDCAGFTLASLASAGLDLEALLPEGTPGEGGVPLLHRMAAERGMLHRRKLPHVGDLVFFDDTWDRNRNGRADDPLTHVGIVEKVAEDGTITFIHRVKRGELRYRMNLFRPDERRDPKTGQVLNHHLRVGGEPGPNAQRLTGQLFHDFATVFR